MERAKVGWQGSWWVGPGDLEVLYVHMCSPEGVAWERGYICACVCMCEYVGQLALLRAMLLVCTWQISFAYQAFS